MHFAWIRCVISYPPHSSARRKPKLRCRPPHPKPCDARARRENVTNIVQYWPADRHEPRLLPEHYSQQFHELFVRASQLPTHHTFVI